MCNNSVSPNLDRWHVSWGEVKLKLMCELDQQLFFNNFFLLPPFYKKTVFSRPVMIGLVASEILRRVKISPLSDELQSK